MSKAKRKIDYGDMALLERELARRAVSIETEGLDDNPLLRTRALGARLREVLYKEEAAESVAIERFRQRSVSDLGDMFRAHTRKVRNKNMNYAISHTKMEDIVRLIKDGHDANHHTTKGITALMSACMANLVKWIPRLIELGANPDAEVLGKTALTIAAAGGNEGSVRVLLRCGATVDYFTTKGRSGLLDAARYGHLPVVVALLEQNASVDAANDERVTAFMEAALYGHASVVPALAGKGADPKAVSAEGKCVLDYAVASGSSDTVRAVVDCINKQRRRGEAMIAAPHADRPRTPPIPPKPLHWYQKPSQRRVLYMEHKEKIQSLKQQSVPHTRVLCSRCCKAPAIIACKECDTNFCDQCCLSHHRILEDGADGSYAPHGYRPIVSGSGDPGNIPAPKLPQLRKSAPIAEDLGKDVRRVAAICGSMRNLLRVAVDKVEASRDEAISWKSNEQERREQQRLRRQMKMYRCPAELKMADFYIKEGRLEEAKTTIDVTLRMQENRFGVDTLPTTYAFVRQVSLYRALGQPSLAMDYCNHITGIFRKAADDLSSSQDRAASDLDTAAVLGMEPHHPLRVRVEKERCETLMQLCDFDSAARFARSLVKRRLGGKLTYNNALVIEARQWAISSEQLRDWKGMCLEDAWLKKNALKHVPALVRVPPEVLECFEYHFAMPGVWLQRFGAPLTAFWVMVAGKGTLRMENQPPIELGHGAAIGGGPLLVDPSGADFSFDITEPTFLLKIRPEVFAQRGFTLEIANSLTPIDADGLKALLLSKRFRKYLLAAATEGYALAMLNFWWAVHDLNELSPETTAFHDQSTEVFRTFVADRNALPCLTVDDRRVCQIIIERRPEPGMFDRIVAAVENTLRWGVFQTFSRSRRGRTFLRLLELRSIVPWITEDKGLWILFTKEGKKSIVHLQRLARGFIVRTRRRNKGERERLRARHFGGSPKSKKPFADDSEEEEEEAPRAVEDGETSASVLRGRASRDLEGTAALILQRFYRRYRIRKRFRDLVIAMFLKKFDETTGKYYYINIRTGEPTWTLPGMGGVTPADIQVKLLCVCGTCEAVRYCRDCRSGYCFMCHRKSHNPTGAFRRHEHFTLPPETPVCCECEDVIATQYCRKCSDYYCDKCFLMRHRSGKRKAHERQRVNVDPELGPIVIPK